MPHEYFKPLSQHLDAIKRSLILNKPTHHIMPVIYQQAVCGSLYSTFSLSLLWLSLASIMHNLPLPFSFPIHLVLFFSFFPWLFPPKLHTVPYPHYHFVLCFPSISSYFPLLAPIPSFLTLHSSFLFSPSCFLSLSFYPSKAPSLQVSNVFGIIRPVYSWSPLTWFACR